MHWSFFKCNELYLFINCLDHYSETKCPSPPVSRMGSLFLDFKPFLPIVNRVHINPTLIPILGHFAHVLCSRHRQNSDEGSGKPKKRVDAVPNTISAQLCTIAPNLGAKASNVFFVIIRNEAINASIFWGHYLGTPPTPVTITNEGLQKDSLLKM